MLNRKKVCVPGWSKHRLHLARKYLLKPGSLQGDWANPKPTPPPPPRSRFQRGLVGQSPTTSKEDQGRHGHERTQTVRGSQGTEKYSMKTLLILLLRSPQAGESSECFETLSAIKDSSPLGCWTTKRLGTQTVWVASSCSKLYYKGRQLRTARAKCSHRCKVDSP